jgi:hypothetical protein
LITINILSTEESGYVFLTIDALPNGTIMEFQIF